MNAATSYDAVRLPEPTRVLLGPGRVITERARRWTHDVLLMAPTPGLGARLWGVPDRLVPGIGCPVVPTPAPRVDQEA